MGPVTLRETIPWRILSLLLFLTQVCAQLPAGGALMGPGMAESLSSVMDCNFNGKTGLCVPSVLKDIVCLPLGFQYDTDTKTCGADNVCCHSAPKTDSPPTATITTTTTTTTTPVPPPDNAAASINLLIPSNTAVGEVIPGVPSTSTKNEDNKGKFTIPASLSAYINPGLTPKPNDKRRAPNRPKPAMLTAHNSKPQASSASNSNVPPGGKSSVKMCRVGAAMGMCVRADLVPSLCLPLGFKAVQQKDCTRNFQCCYNAGQAGPPQLDFTTTTSTTTATPIAKPLDAPSSMDTCSPQSGVAGLCIRADIAPVVCTPLGYHIGGQLSCASDRVCCYSPTNSVPVPPNPTITIQTSMTESNEPDQPADFSPLALSTKSCQLGGGINGVCVPANLLSSCPLFGRKISPYGCATRHGAPTEFCCYQANADNNREIEPASFASLAGSIGAPKLDSVVCGRKGLTGIEPRALPRVSGNMFRTEKMLGSHDTMPGEFCWHASLFDEQDVPFCNGALIHREWVVTAAHCVKRVTPAKTYVKLGMWSLRMNNATSLPSSRQDLPSASDPLTAPQIVRVLEAFVHTNFDGITLDNNIALLHLDTAADLSEPQVCLACLPSIPSYQGNSCSLTGFSSADGSTFTQDSTLSQLDFTILNSTSCDASLRTTGKLQSNFRLNREVTICGAANANEDTCRGDGGSPLVCQNTEGNYELTGLVSWGLACGVGTPSVFTRVWAFNTWMQEIVRRYSQSYL